VEAVSSIRNPRTRHALVIGSHVTWFSDQYYIKIHILSTNDNGDDVKNVADIVKPFSFKIYELLSNSVKYICSNLYRN